MNGLIPLGVPGDAIIQLLTVGLSLGSPLTPALPPGSGISIDLPAVIASDVTGPFTGNAYAIPAMGTRITWQCSGAVVTSVTLQASLNGVNFSTLDTMSAAGVQTIQAGPTFVRAVVTTGVGVTVSVIIKREKR